MTRLASSATPRVAVCPRRISWAVLLALIFLAASATDLGAPALAGKPGADDAAAFPARVRQLCRVYIAAFGRDETHLVYHHRLDGPRGLKALASPAEIAAGTVGGRKMPYGYGSGIQDVALEGGQLLFALCDAYDATGDPEIAEMAGWLFQGMKRVASVSPEPGFVPRGPHPDGKSYYKDSSRDQHAALTEALWRYGRSRLATEDDRRFIAREIDEIGRRLERNDWKILVEDGSRVAHVGFGWKQATSIGAVSLLSFLAMAADATGDAHWREAYKHYSEENGGFRWQKLLHPSAAERWPPLTLYSNQFAQALAALKRSEPDPRRRRQIDELLCRLAERALRSNVFDPACWRRLDWAGNADDQETNERLAAFGLALERASTVGDVFDRFDPAIWQSENQDVRYVADKLCYGIPTAAFHKALLTSDRQLIEEIAPRVRRMVEVMLDFGQHYQAGENFNRSVVLGLLLVVRQSVDSDSSGSEPCRGVAGYGSELSMLGQLGVGPCMDAAVDDGKLYVVGGGKLHVADLAEPASPRLIARLEGLGAVRQICVQRGIAYVTSREDGLFLVDVRRPDRPRLLSHYDTVELATGIAVSGGVAFVACRTAGVELVDVSDPDRPAHLSTVRTGEAQSVDVRDGILYAGVWGTRELVVCDVSNPRAPRVLARAPLDGYGDGVDVCSPYCYVATGHHSRTLPCREPGDPGFGRGHGLQIFNVSDPAHPRLVGRVKLPPLYRLGMDMWDVIAADRYAFVADTYNGVFVVDVSEPSRPHVVAHRRLPFVEQKGDPSPVGGFAVGDGVVYAAGAWSDLHVIGASQLAAPVAAEADRSPGIPPPAPSKADPRFRSYRPAGQVHAVAFSGDVGLVAAGMAGVHAVELWPKTCLLEQYPTDGFAFDVAACGQRVYVAEGTGGLSIWERAQDGKLAKCGRYHAGSQSIRQVVVPPPGRFALLHVGANTLHVVDVRDPARPVCALRDSQVGLFYCAPLARELLDGRYACCHWHASGLYWYDLAGDVPVPTGQQFPHRIGSRNGVDVRGPLALATCRGGYAMLTRDETRSPDDLPVARVPGFPFHGKPTVDGTTLYVSDRNGGRVVAIRITDPARPRLVNHLDLEEHPGLVVVHNGIPVIPGGYQGLLVWERANEAKEAAKPSVEPQQP